MISRKNLLPEKFQVNFTLWFVILILFIFFLWAYFAELDQITRAPGEIIASSRTQVIQSFDGGVIKDIVVKEGQAVSKGQLLLTFDKTKIEASYFESRGKAAALRANRARIIAEIHGGQPKFSSDVADYPQFKKNQLDLLQNRRQSIKSEISSLTELYKLARKELLMNKPLVQSGDISLADVLRIQRQVTDIQSQIVNRQNKYTQDLQAELSKTEEDLASSEQLLTQRKDQLQNLELVSPMNGIVKNIKFNTLGGVVKPSEEVMQIVPDEDELIIEAKLKPVDIAFVKKGLDANIKVDAYDSTRYGTLKGKVIYVSPDTMSENLKQGETAYYRTQIKTLSKQFSNRPDQKLELQTGMTTTVEIKTGGNTVLNYLIKPLIKTLDESFTER